jgi:AcrR family transcriptional regulator
MIETSGLRERKKAETRAAIGQAVLLLALQRGLDDVTTEQIAAQADVSVRTFHNYFGSKEEALTEAWRTELDVHIQALRERPAGEPILDSLEAVMIAIVARMSARPRDGATVADLLRTSVAMPRQRSVLLDEAIRLITAVVAERTATDVATDLYPHLVTVTAISAVVTTFELVPPDAPRSERQRLVRDAFALLRDGLRPRTAFPSTAGSPA